MKRSILYKLVLMVFAGIAISSCRDKPVYPSEPFIVYKDFLRYGNPSNPDSVELVVSFTDNEGDIGLEPTDTLPLGVFGPGNFWMIYFYWDTIGVDHWETDLPWTTQIDTLFIPYRIPPVLPDGDKNEPMKGFIYVKQKKPFPPYRKIRYKAYMYDKAKHKSNTIDTPVIDF